MNARAQYVSSYSWLNGTLGLVFVVLLSLTNGCAPKNFSPNDTSASQGNGVNGSPTNPVNNGNGTGSGTINVGGTTPGTTIGPTGGTTPIGPGGAIVTVGPGGGTFTIDPPPGGTTPPVIPTNPNGGPTPTVSPGPGGSTVVTVPPGGGQVIVPGPGIVTVPPGNPGETTVSPLPKLTLYEPLCHEYSTCPAYFILTPSPSSSLKFDWITDDEKWKSNASVYLQPNVNYVPTSGTVTFQANQGCAYTIPGLPQGAACLQININSLKVPNVNPPMVIPFLFMNAYWGGQPIDVTLFLR